MSSYKVTVSNNNTKVDTNTVKHETKVTTPSYKVAVSNNNTKVDTTTVKHETKVTTPEYATSLSRVGGQGSKGDSITDVALNASNEIIITVSNSSGVVVETFNLGIGSATTFASLTDVDFTGITDGQVVKYDAGTSTYIPHTLTTSSMTTSSMTDVDNTGKTDGAVLLFDGTSNKYKATTQINNANTFMIGGSF